MEEYIRIITEQIRCARAREGIAQELRNHIEDQAEAYEKEGMEHETALAEAVRQMGDPVAVGIELDRIHRPGMDWRLLGMTVLLSTGGLLIMALVDAFLWQITGEAGLPFSPGIGKQLLCTGIGLALMLAVCFLDYSLIGRYTWLIYAGFSLLLTVYGRLSGTINGMHRSLILPVYLFVPIYAGVLYQLRGQGSPGFVKGLLLLLPPVLFSRYFIPSLATAFSLLLICVCMLLTAVWKGWFTGCGQSREPLSASGRVSPRRRKRLLAALTGACVLLGVTGRLAYTYLLFDFQKRRIAAWLNPNEYSADAGYLYVQLKKLLAGLNWFSPADTADAALLSGWSFSGNYELLGIFVCFGAAAGFLALFLLAVFLFHLFRISLRQKNQLGMMLGTGCSLVMTLHVLLGIGVSFGLLPATTVTVPFLTGGGSAAVVYPILVGFLLSVCRYQNVLPDTAPRARRAGS